MKSETNRRTHLGVALGQHDRNPRANLGNPSCEALPNCNLSNPRLAELRLVAILTFSSSLDPGTEFPF